MYIDWGKVEAPPTPYLCPCQNVLPLFWSFVVWKWEETRLAHQKSPILDEKIRHAKFRNYNDVPNVKKNCPIK